MYKPFLYPERSVEWHAARLYQYGDYETAQRAKEDLRVQELATRQYKKLLQRVHNLERRVKQNEFNRGQSETFQEDQAEKDCSCKKCNSKGAPSVR